MLLQYVLNGVLLGGLYGLIGVSIVIVYKSTKVFNFAAGSLLTMGGLICLSLVTQAKISIWIALPVSMAACGVLGILIERIALRPLLAQPIFTLVMATLLLDRVLYGVNAMLWTGYMHTFPRGVLPGKTLRFGTLFVSNELLYAFVGALVCFCFLMVLFQKMNIGLKMRSTAESHSVAMSLGINIKWIFGISWAIAAIIGAITGVLLGNRLGLQVSITPAIAFKAVPAIILGGLESIPGVMVGGLIIGALEQLSGAFLGSKFMEVTPYVILVLVLMLRPEGLFGIKRIERI